MSATFIRQCGQHGTHTLYPGALQAITPHCGMDRDLRVDIRFEDAFISMSSETLRDIVRRGQEALVAQGEAS